ncbi:MAG: AzlD domain-containing protein [Pseudonocardia sp.]|uniref:AzlD domain-containing protein n=1 Tax=unclassified Pseudonocardia TaxID=2619320 RepID=UPI000B33E667|nr:MULTISPECIES: AzlD domain-containing protein [unclassified Pseudonocardia]MBN9111316.1 AzlD domain-containing protein [Pseudonocardia sp.]
MGELLVLAAIGVGTYLMRAAFLATAGARPPAAVARLLQYVGPAVLAAIALPALVAPHGRIALEATVPALLAALVAGVVWRFTRSLPLALFGGLVVAWGVTWLLT